ncbi:TPA: hypothetical protein EYP38_01925, partial [Candidatus Micrarchaeota archaeon]|nr:hypothetical protein [Candidatus Micrarchaeota archaeon]
MRAFIFSLDAFVAFTLALIAIYSLIFFSSVPSSYYYLLTQGHFLARDVLVALSTTECDSDQFGACPVTGSQLDNIISGGLTEEEVEERIQDTVGEMIPDQFGYSFEVSDDEGESWSMLYDTRNVAGDDHQGEGKKLVVSSQMITFGYVSLVGKDAHSPYWYDSCGHPETGGIILTCDESPNADPSALGDLV